jgi:lipopolysaccharide/colanic/teichoic acid biosynthesis glycosyltransferase
MPWPVSSLTSGIKVDSVGVVPLIGPLSSNIEGLNFILKRLFDLVVGSIVLVAAAPVLLLSIAALRLCDGPPLLFRQTRIGRHGETFELLKLRTMRAESSDDLHRAYVQKWIGENGHGGNGPEGPKMFKLTADPRVTPIGRWLRRLSLDELPQLINVLRGEMSLIGPRPALPYELGLYQDWHRRRLGALPGITGLWQVSGRNELSFDQMVKLDVKYIQEWSFGQDMRILIRTLPAIFRGL